jgi:hydroxylamine reductase (hybrid-cluster protein)
MIEDFQQVGKMEDKMFCYQCEQTAKGTGCTVQGVCGKSPEVAALQDLLLYSLMGLSQVAVEGRKVGVSDNDVNVFTVKAAFSTLTNVDFDPDRFMDLILKHTVLYGIKGVSAYADHALILGQEDDSVYAADKGPAGL